MQRGCRPLARGRWRVRGWAYRIRAGERGAGGPGRGEVTTGHSAEPPPTGPGCSLRGAGAGTGSTGKDEPRVGEGSGDLRQGRGRRGQSSRVCRSCVPPGKKQPPPQKKNKKITDAQLLLYCINFNINYETKCIFFFVFNWISYPVLAQITVKSCQIKWLLELPGARRVSKTQSLSIIISIVLASLNLAYNPFSPECTHSPCKFAISFQKIKFTPNYCF